MPHDLPKWFLDSLKAVTSFLTLFTRWWKTPGVLFAESSATNRAARSNTLFCLISFSNPSRADGIGTTASRSGGRLASCSANSQSPWSDDT